MTWRRTERRPSASATTTARAVRCRTFSGAKRRASTAPTRSTTTPTRRSAQLFELLALIKSLGDQISLFSMEEPPEIQFQDLLARPFRNWTNTRGSRFANSHDTRAYWQARMLDVPKCLAKTRLDAEPLTFNLVLSDPIEMHLDGTNAWRGCAGDYVITLGRQSGAEPGRSANLPALTASVGAFTRLWLGVRNASSLTLTDDLHGDDALLGALDRALRLPQPHIGWDF